MVFKRFFRLKNLVLSKLDHILNDNQVIREKVDIILKQNEQILGNYQNPQEVLEYIREDVVPQDMGNDPVANFHGEFYLRHNQRRQEHLASLNLPIHNTSVLEVGAGIGDHTSFFLDRNCSVVTTEARENNVQLLKQRFPYIRVEQLDLENPQWNEKELFDIIYCYGLLYHLKTPLEAIAFMSKHCNQFLLLETCVSYEAGSAINLCTEAIENPTQSFSGTGCRPTRQWIFETLQEFFPFVYVPLTQPSHPEFPIDWITLSKETAPGLTRAIFIAAKQELNSLNLVTYLPKKQSH